MTKTIECYCHDPINKIGVHYHVITQEENTDAIHN